MLILLWPGTGWFLAFERRLDVIKRQAFIMGEFPRYITRMPWRD